jgi:hypothetical protein
VHPPIAASSSSTGEKSVPFPLAIVIWPPRALVTVYVLFAIRSMLTPRWVDSVAMCLGCHVPSLAECLGDGRQCPIDQCPIDQCPIHDGSAGGGTPDGV